MTPKIFLHLHETTNWNQSERIWISLRSIVSFKDNNHMSTIKTEDGKEYYSRETAKEIENDVLDAVDKNQLKIRESRNIYKNNMYKNTGHLFEDANAIVMVDLK